MAPVGAEWLGFGTSLGAPFCTCQHTLLPRVTATCPPCGSQPLPSLSAATLPAQTGRCHQGDAAIRESGSLATSPAIISNFSLLFLVSVRSF